MEDEDLSILERFRLESMPNQDEVDREFCRKRCCAWLGAEHGCSTVWNPGLRKGKCLWTYEELKGKA